MKAMAEFIAVEIGVRCKHILSLNLVITLIISGTTVKAASQIPNLTILPDRFNEAKIVCHSKGKFLAALFF
jgi:ABC-type enterochelin transport system permease subunit